MLHKGMVNMLTMVTLNTDTRALAEHVLSADHHIDWDNTTILDHHLFTQHRCLMESWYIHREFQCSATQYICNYMTHSELC